MSNEVSSEASNDPPHVDSGASKDDRGRDRARALTLGAALLFSTGGMAIKATEIGGWELAGLRSAVAATFLLIALPRARRGLSWRVVPVGIAYALTLVFFTLATKLTTAANAIFIQYMAPVWILLLGPWALGESLRRRDVPFLLAILAGMVCFFAGARDPQATAPDPLVGNLYALASSITLGFALTGLRWLALRGNDDVDPAGAATAAGNAIAVAICLPWIGDPTAIGAVDWLWIVYLGAIQIGLGYALLTRAAGSLPAIEMSLLLLIEPVLNPVWAAVVHGEHPGGLAIAGGAIVVVALAWRSLRDAGGRVG